VPEAKRLRALESEKRPAETMLAEAILDNATLKKLLGKKG
jgi:hypothetical protein